MGAGTAAKKAFFCKRIIRFSALPAKQIARSLIVPIIFQDEVIGFVGVANKSADYLQQECEMLENIARYIAPLLDARLKKDRQGKKRRLAEEKLRNLTRKLSIKVKVMKCLRAISELLQNPRLTEDEIFQGVVDLAPSGWQYPEITCARIVLKEKIFQTANYRETPWKISSPIKMDQEIQGTLEVCYLQEKPLEAEGPFLQEERGLLEDITERLAVLMERKQIERELAQAHRLEAVGQLAAGIAHEINTPTQYRRRQHPLSERLLSVTLMRCFDKFHQLLQAAKNGDLSPEMLAEMETFVRDADLHYLNREIPKAIDQSLEGVGRVAAIVRAMKEFSHPGSEQKQNIDLAHAIENALTISRNEWKYVAKVVTDFDPQLAHGGLFAGRSEPGDFKPDRQCRPGHRRKKRPRKPGNKARLPSAPGKTAIGPKSASKIPAPAFPRKSATASSIRFLPPRNPARAAAKDCPSPITSSQKNTAARSNFKAKSDKALRSSFVCQFRKK